MCKQTSRKRFVIIARAALAARRDPLLKGKRRRAVALCALARASNPLVRAARHFALVCRHKTYVFLYCAYAGMPFRGFMHDWSKFSPVEFFESVRYFTGRRSPVGLCREIEGRSLGWLHHKGRNKHHFEYWHDSVDASGSPLPTPNAIRPIPMPFRYALEMLCDTIAASRAYNGGKFSYDLLEKWWRTRQGAPVNMAASTKRFCDLAYAEMKRDGNCSALRRARELFDRAEAEIRAESQEEN